MTVLSHRATYQGYHCRAVKYRRTDGLSPETGYVDINIKDLGSIKITMPQIPWRAAGGRKEIPGQLPIGQAFRLYGSELSGGPGQTTTDTPAKFGVGLQLVGDLVLETFSNGGTEGRIAYRDVYVAFEGIEEITERLANPKAHNQGFVRIPISDIRQFYAEYGLLFQDINCILRSGIYDPRTVQQGGEPWSLVQVLQFLFSQLPGSPTIHKKSDIFSMGTNPPNEIIGEGEPVSGILQELLNQYALVPKFLPEGSYLIMKRWDTSVKPGEIARSPGSPSKWPHLKTEKRSVNGTNRPPLVCVKGRRRVQRVTIPYVAIIQWTDGRYYQLDDIGALANGYSILNVNSQVLNNEGKNFQDVIGRASSGAVGYQWMQLLRKWAYKGYAPASAFREIPNPGLTQTGAPVATGQSSRPPEPPKKTIHVIEDDDIDFIPFLPAVDAPWYRNDLKLAGLEMLFKGASSKKSKGGDFDEVVLLPPVVKSRTIGEMWFQDAGEITVHMKRVADSYGKDKEYCEARVKIAEDRGRSIVDHINASNNNAENVIRLTKLNSQPLVTIEIDDETRNLAKGFGVIESDIKKVIDDFGLEIPVKVALKMVQTELAEWKDNAKQADEILKAHLKQVTTYAAVYASYRGFMGIGNLPTKVAEHGKYSFDSRSGIILFAEPQCVGQSALVMSDEWQRVVADGGVSASFGYEMRFNAAQDWTMVYVGPNPVAPGKPATAAIYGYSRPSGIKAKLERIPDVTMYLDEYGQPMNQNFVSAAAVRKAQFQVSQPDGVEGYHSIYHGFVPCVLDSGINCVQHEWDGGKNAPYTHVFQNYPGGVGPLGPAMVPTQSAAEGRSRTRATMRELEER